MFITVNCFSLVVSGTLVLACMLKTIHAVSGVTYTRWGKSSCPSTTGAQLVYSGRVGGTHYNFQGGSAERICLPDDPVYTSDVTLDSIIFHSVIQGAEYEFQLGPARNVTNHNVPCVVCYVPTRAVTVMVPAKPTCPPSWTREYFGYLTADHDGYYRTMYTCIDSSPDVIASSSGNEDGALFHHTTTNCNGLPCPPYEATRTFSCAVCTK